MPIQCDLFMTLKLPHVGDFYMLSEMASSIVQVHVEIENWSFKKAAHYHQEG